MRLWHKDLISVLPKQQLLGQWRECCCIARNITENSTPNHLLVNKIMEYPMWHFCTYTDKIHTEMLIRGYKCNFNNFRQYFPFQKYDGHIRYIFEDWHNDRYLQQCYFNLQEKYDCGGISENEWKKIDDFFAPIYYQMFKGL